MKLKQLSSILAVTLLITLVSPLGVWAESLEDLSEKEAKISEESEVLNKDIMTALNEVNEKYAEVEKIKGEVSEVEAAISQSETEIEKTQQSIERRKEVVGERMKTIQLNGEKRTWQVLLDAESISDFVNKAYAMTVLQKAEREKINQLTEDKEKLSELYQTVTDKQEELQEKESYLQSEADVMNEQVVDLKQKLSDNQVNLQLIANEKQVEEKRLAEEKAAEEASKQEQLKVQELAKEVSAAENEAQAILAKALPEETNSNNTSSQEEVVNNPASSTSEGQVFYMQSTAYSWQETGHSITATGLDLRQQSNVVAVDPNVIPLGSLVQVEGYGFAIAADTGGAIKGNIVDVHFPTVDQCLIWGRRYNVKVVVQ